MLPVVTLSDRCVPVTKNGILKQNILRDGIAFSISYIFSESVIRFPIIFILTKIWYFVLFFKYLKIGVQSYEIYIFRLQNSSKTIRYATFSQE